MKNTLALCGVVAALAALSGCDSASKQDLTGVEQRLDTKVGQAETKLSQTAADLDRKITAIDTKFANVLAIDQQVKNAIEDMKAHAKQLEVTNDVLKRLLEAQRASLKEQLASVEEQLAVLKGK